MKLFEVDDVIDVDAELNQGQSQDEKGWWTPTILLGIGSHFEVLMEQRLLLLRQVSVLVRDEREKLLLVHEAVFVVVGLGYQPL